MPNTESRNWNVRKKLKNEETLFLVAKNKPFFVKRVYLIILLGMLFYLSIYFNLPDNFDKPSERSF